jgi:hypothetical protein
MIDVAVAMTYLPAVFGLAEAEAVGLSSRTVERAVRGGVIRRLARGVFVAESLWRAEDTSGASCSPPAMSSRRDRHLLLVQACARLQPRAVISHHSAALVHGLPIPWRLPPWVAMTTDRSARTATPRTLLRLEPARLPQADIDVATAAPLAVTTVARTVIDCLRELPLPDAVAIADAALRTGSVSGQSLKQIRHGQRGWPYITNADRAMPVLDGRRENWFESWSFVRLWQLGIPPPEPQVAVFDQHDRFLGRVDGLWIDKGVVAEADGAGKYLGEFDPDGASGKSAARAVLAEKVREDRMRDCGLEFVRWGLDEMAQDPRSVARRVERARNRGNSTRFKGRLLTAPDQAPAPTPTPHAHPQLVAAKPPFLAA